MDLDVREAVFQTAARRVPAKRRLRRTTVRRYVVDLEFMQATVFDGRRTISEHAVRALNEATWRMLEDLHERGVHAVWVDAQRPGETLIIFSDSLGSVIVERDAEIYAIDRRGRGERAPSGPRRFEVGVNEWVIAIPAAAVAEELAHLAGGMDVPRLAPAAIVLLAAAGVAYRRRRN